MFAPTSRRTGEGGVGSQGACCYNSFVRRRSGVTLVEVLISVVIFSVGVVTVMGVFPMLFELNRGSWQLATALAAGQEKMDELLAGRKFVVSGQDAVTTLPSGRRSWSGQTDPMGNARIQTVHVYVSWNDKWRQRSIVLTSALTNP